jgi:alkaline phosphatase
MWLGDAPVWAAKNVILMIADGSGFGAWQAASMYEGKWDAAKRQSTQVYDGPGWVKYACTTYPLSLSKRPTGKTAQEPALCYQEQKAWDTAAARGSSGRTFAAYQYLTGGATDSAAAATALATGVKTYNNAINWSVTNEPMTGRSVAEIAKHRGRAVGAIATVPWSHATPAGLGGAHNTERDNYRGIANEMLKAPYLDVIMGTGNPDFDDQGRPAAKKADYVGGPATWEQLKQGKHPGHWRLIQSKAEFEALAAAAPADAKKVLGVPEVYATLQQARGKYRKEDAPFSQPLNSNVPTLATMTKAALNALAREPNGFYLMIEGGAVDWANHANQPARMIEEQIDFHQAVQAVVDWVQAHSNWNETLLICTADHETGMLWGKQSDTVAFDPIVERGKGNVPDLRYNSKSHTNSLVPLVARGSGCERFAALVRGIDAAARRHWGISGQYVDNTDVFKVMNAALAAGPSSAPATAAGTSGSTSAPAPEPAGVR